MDENSTKLNENNYSEFINTEINNEEKVYNIFENVLDNFIEQDI